MAVEENGVFVSTRRQLHGVAELLIAGPQYRRDGTIRLSVTGAGFRGVILPIGVEGTDLVWPGGRMRLAGPVAELAAAAGVDAEAPTGVYPSGAGLPVDAVLDVDPDAASRVHGSLHIGAEALTVFAPNQQPVLWPEHFDVAITVNEVNYGVSTGDSYHDSPYAYVGPHTTRQGPFWNAPFGALRALDSGVDVAGVVEFFKEADDHLI
jgi:hypothetical protein